MEIEREDIISVIVTLFILEIWYLTLLVFDRPLASILILWAGMISLTFVYTYIYKKKKRDMKLLKTRYMVSAVPIYPVLGYYVYLILTGEKLSGNIRLIPFFVIFAMLFLNALVVYIYGRKNI